MRVVRHLRNSLSNPTTMNNTQLAAKIPDRSDTDIPLQVRLILSICEVATGWHEWQNEHCGEPKAHFCEGVFDYWWDDELIEPSFDQLFQRPLDPDKKWSGWPSRKRFAYQQGAMVGYQLREKYE